MLDFVVKLFLLFFTKSLDTSAEKPHNRFCRLRLFSKTDNTARRFICRQTLIVILKGKKMKTEIETVVVDLVWRQSNYVGDNVFPLWDVPSGKGGNGFCGPTAIAATTGVTTNFADKIAKAITGKRKITGLCPRDLMKVINSLDGMSAHNVYPQVMYSRDRFCGSRRRDLVRVGTLVGSLNDGVYIIVAANHFFAISKDKDNVQFADSAIQTPVDFYGGNLGCNVTMRQVVKEVIQVTVDNTLAREPAEFTDLAGYDERVNHDAHSRRVDALAFDAAQNLEQIVDYIEQAKLREPAPAPQPKLNADVTFKRIKCGSVYDYIAKRYVADEVAPVHCA